MPPKGKGRGKAPKNQHQLCGELPLGEVLTDLKKKSWKIGSSIGSGGFGLIYKADEASKSAVTENAPFVIKVEPHGNGPLFSEIAFYQRAAMPDHLDKWKKSSKTSCVGVPPYVAHGLHNRDGESFRFMVMPRFGSDLHKLWLKAEKKFKRETVAKIAVMMINALEYLHEREYVHADIKGANILCDYKDPSKLFLVDYGLAYRYMVNNVHKKYDPDPRKAHNGTIEYTSTDAHKGANPSRRGDIEILGFVLLHLFAGRLLWEDKLSDCDYVREQKIKFMSNVETCVKKTCTSEAPGEIIQLLQHAAALKYEETPNYEKLRNMFTNALKSIGATKSSIDYNCASIEDSPTTLPSKKSRKTKSKPEKETVQQPHPLNKRGARRVAMSSTEHDESSSEEEVVSKPVKKAANRKASHKKIEQSSSPSDEMASDLQKPKGRLRQTKSKRLSDSEDVIDQSSDEIEEYKPSSKRQKKSLKTVKPQQKPTSKSKGTTKTTNSESETSAAKANKKTTLPPYMVPKSSDNTKQTSSSADDSPAKCTRQQKQLSSLGSGSGTGSSHSEQSLKSSEDQENTSDSDMKENINKASSAKTKSSRYSMAPLHTQSVLTKNDKLTGSYSGKHPVFTRRRKVNMPKATVSTQTTPTLNRNRSKK